MEWKKIEMGLGQNIFGVRHYCGCKMLMNDQHLYKNPAIEVYGHCRLLLPRLRVHCWNFFVIQGWNIACITGDWPQCLCIIVYAQLKLVLLFHFMMLKFIFHYIAISHFKTGCHYCLLFPPTSGHFKTGCCYGFSFPPIVVPMILLSYFLPLFLLGPLYKVLPFYQSTVQYWFFSWLRRSSLGFHLDSSDDNIRLIIWSKSMTLVEILLGSLGSGRLLCFKFSLL